MAPKCSEVGGLTAANHHGSWIFGTVARYEYAGTDILVLSHVLDTFKGCSMPKVAVACKSAGFAAPGRVITDPGEPMSDVARRHIAESDVLDVGRRGGGVPVVGFAGTVTMDASYIDWMDGLAVPTTHGALAGRVSRGSRSAQQPCLGGFDARMAVDCAVRDRAFVEPAVKLAENVEAAEVAPAAMLRLIELLGKRTGLRALSGQPPGVEYLARQAA